MASWQSAKDFGYGFSTSDGQIPVMGSQAVVPISYSLGLLSSALNHAPPPPLPPFLPPPQSLRIVIFVLEPLPPPPLLSSPRIVICPWSFASASLSSFRIIIFVPDYLAALPSPRVVVLVFLHSPECWGSPYWWEFCTYSHLATILVVPFQLQLMVLVEKGYRKMQVNGP